MGLHAHPMHEGYDYGRSTAFHTGGYGYYHDVRNAIARAAGWPLENSGGKHPMDLPVLGEYRPNAENYLGCWAKDPADILAVLMFHSDCDGRIMAHHCEALAERLAGLVDKVEADYRENVQSMITALRDAAEHNTDIIYS